MIGLRRISLTGGRFLWKFVSESKRPLYSPAFLGINGFLENRKKISQSIQDIPRLKGQLKQLCEDNGKGLVFMEDLKKIMGVTHDMEDLKLLLSLLKKYCKQKSVVVLHGYHFGPEILRLLHIMNKPQEALQLIEDEELFPHFKEYTTLLILLDLLFENEQYKDVVRVYEHYRERADFSFPPMLSVLIYLAACYKLNTAEYFEKAVQIHNMSAKSCVKIPRRNVLLFGALAIKQNQPLLAIEAFFSIMPISWHGNFKFMAFAQAKRFEEVFTEIQNSLMNSVDGFCVTREALSFIEEEIKKDENDEMLLKFEELKGKLDSLSLISDQPLEKYLFSEIKPKKNNLKGLQNQRKYQKQVQFDKGRKLGYNY